MKVLSTDGLTKLIELIKSAFISVDDTVSTNSVTLATVATSGSYNDLSDKPTSTSIQINGTSIINSGVANIVTAGVYNADSNKIATMSDLPTVPTNVSAFTNDSGYITNSAITNMQTTTNLVTSLSASSTDTQYPSAKCVYDIVGDIETALNTINSGV